MKMVKILSYGVKANVLPTLDEGVGYHNYSDVLSVQKTRTQNKEMIHRENRNLLNFITETAIDATVQCFNTFQTRYGVLDDSEREMCKIFSSHDSTEQSFDSLCEHLKKYGSDSEAFFLNLGSYKSLMNPLDMLRKLSTNLIYHLSNIYGLTGGGYPLQGASLGGMLALSSAINDMIYEDKSVLLNATGDMLSVDSIASFNKMNMISINGSPGFVPNVASVSLMLSSLPRYSDLNVCAEIIACTTYFFTGIPNLNHWKKLYGALLCKHGELLQNEPLYLIQYDNGVQHLSTVEDQAVQQFFPNALVKKYKNKFGYTGTANNMLDLCASLDDSSIPSGALVILNGIGFNTGLGCVVYRKGNLNA